MIRELGPPTWFVTLSAGEYEWADIEDHLRLVNPDMPEKMTISELCAFDPVTVARHFRLREEAVLQFIKHGKPLGQVEHYFIRLEYQARGAGHYHFLLWIKDAPVVGKSSEEDIADFVTHYFILFIEFMDSPGRVFSLIEGSP